MNIAHTKCRAVTDAASGGSARVRVQGGRLVRRVAVCCMLAFAGISVSHAGPGDKERDERAAQQRDRQQGQRQYDTRAFEARAEEQRRQLQAQQEQNERNNAEANRRSGRMTPDERRDLRRQINEAGADLYPRTPRR